MLYSLDCCFVGCEQGQFLIYLQFYGHGRCDCEPEGAPEAHRRPRSTSWSSARRSTLLFLWRHLGPQPPIYHDNSDVGATLARV